MKVYNISFVELVTSQVKIKAKTLEKAKKIVNSGYFYGDEVIDRDNFEITESYEESEE
jgi:hypothetical protein